MITNRLGRTILFVLCISLFFAGISGLSGCEGTKTSAAEVKKSDSTAEIERLYKRITSFSTNNPDQIAAMTTNQKTEFDGKIADAKVAYKDKDVSSLRGIWAWLDNTRSAYQTAQEAKQAAEQQAEVEKLAGYRMYTTTFTDSQGNKQEVTLKLSRWIKGSDSKSLQMLWNNVKGTGDISASGSDSMSTVYLIGTLACKNVTPDWPASNFGNGECIITFWGTPGGISGNALIQSAEVYSQDSDGVVTAHSLATGLVSPKFQSNSWGPTPFCIKIPNAFSPNYPGGDSSLLDRKYYFGMIVDHDDLTSDQQFTISKSW